jgi:hypothetical protein
LASRLSGRAYTLANARCEIVFHRPGFAPHYAEHIIDPKTGAEVLVMADPHIRRSALIYDVETGQIVWEVQVPGGQLKANPHIARLLLEEVPAIKAAPGDLLCADRDNRYILIDRATKRAKWSLKLPDAGWAHDALPTRDLKDLIVTDYSSGFIRRVRFDGTPVWNLKLGYGAAKLAKVGGPVPSGIHSSSFGGDLLVAVNQETRGIYEVSEEEGRIAWSCPPDDTKNVFPTFRPHSALRLGLAELDGNLTVIGMEAGGGVVAVDREGRPRWGYMKPHFNWVGREAYRPTTTGLMETTHVFTTLDGRLGVIDWNGVNASTLIVFNELPQSPRLYWFLALHRELCGEEFLDPPVEVAEWRRTRLQIVNEGGVSLVWQVLATLSPHLTPTAAWRKAHIAKLGPQEADEFVAEGYAAVRVAVRTETATKYTLTICHEV